MMLFQSEDRFELANQGLSDLGHRRDALPTRLHRGLPERNRPDPRFLQDQIKRFEEGVDVEREAVIDDPTIDRHAERSHASVSEENAWQILPEASLEFKFLKQREDGLAQAREIGVEVDGETVEREGEVNGQLAWKMENAPSSAIHPVDLYAKGPQLLVVGDDMRSAPRTAHADGWRMLADDQRGTGAFTEIVDQPALELLSVLEFDETEEVNLQWRIARIGQRGWHRQVSISVWLKKAWQGL